MKFSGHVFSFFLPDQVALVYWSDGAEVGFTLDQYKKQQDVVQAIRTIEFQGGKTNTAQALRLLRTQVFQVNIGGGQLGQINLVELISGH